MKRTTNPNRRWARCARCGKATYWCAKYGCKGLPPAPLTYGPVFTKPQYDSEDQAWTVINAAGFRVYIRCGHPEETQCPCYGRAYHNKPVAHDRLDFDGNLRPPTREYR